MDNKPRPLTIGILETEYGYPKGYFGIKHDKDEPVLIRITGSVYNYEGRLISEAPHTYEYQFDWQWLILMQGVKDNLWTNLQAIEYLKQYGEKLVDCLEHVRKTLAEHDIKI